MPRYDTITFLTDYGTRDEFVGVVKGVMRQIAPHATVIDLSHDIGAYDVRAGGLMLARAAQYLPSGVVLAVVDPGVGSERRAIAVEVGDGESVLVGPDNGLLAPVVALVGGASRVVELTNPRYQLPAPGATFAGRDIFGPAAAHLCAGVPLEEFGPAVAPESLRPALLGVARHTDGAIEAEVLWIDTFGNAQLNVGPEDLDGAWPSDDALVVALLLDGVPVKTRVAKRVASYAELGVGELGLVVDSYGLVALAANKASAAAELGLSAGDGVRLAPPEEGAGSSGPRRGGVAVGVELRPRGGRP